MSEYPPPPRSEADLVALGRSMLRDRFPSDWHLSDASEGPRRPRTDAVFLLRSPDGDEAEVLVKAKRLLEVRDVAGVAEQLAVAREERPSRVGLVVSRYLTKSTRERLSQAGLSYADATGNLMLRVESPTVFISDRGANSDPWRGPGRPKGTLKGAPAAKVVRALLDFPGPLKVSELVRRSGASTGSVYRVLEFLEVEALAERNQAGLLSVPDWSAVLRRWSDDYQFLRTNSVTQLIAPRGLDALLATIRDRDVRDYAITGSVAAATWTAYAPTRSAMIYVPDVERAMGEWGLRNTDFGANVILAQPAYDVVLERAIDRPDGLRVAAPTQVAVDLMTGPGRAPAEAEELIDWMKRNEQLWR